MWTKSEENIMDKDIGSKIVDHIIKPVNPNQVLLSIKKNVHQQQLVTEQTTADYQAEFGRISTSLGEARTFADWCAIYRKIVGWEVELTDSTDQSIRDVLAFQKNEANNEFCNFVRRNYLDWINGRNDDRPTMSHTLMRSKIFPEIGVRRAKPHCWSIDKLRYDSGAHLAAAARPHEERKNCILPTPPISRNAF